MINNIEKKRKAHLITLVLMALYLSLFESLIPKPFPWMKLGLANLSTLIAFIIYDRRMGVEVFFLRVLVQGIMLGTLLTPSFVISLLSGSISIFIMYILFSYKKYFSTIAISLCSGLVHNIMQLVVVYFLLFRDVDIYSKSVVLFVLIFVIMGAISGGLIGFIAYKYVEKKEKFGGIKNGKKILWYRWNKGRSK